MILYITSDMGGVSELSGAPKAIKLKSENGYAQNVKRDLDQLYPVEDYPELNCLVFAANPDNQELNDSYCAELFKGFALTGLRIKNMDLYDSRGIVNVSGNSEHKEIDGYHVLFMMGGHAPDQNRFFKEIGLREKMVGYPGIILALSAGSMNCADIMYCLPECEGETAVPSGNRFIRGLGLTSFQIVPHYQYLKTIELDGRRMIEDIVAEDSYGHEFIALCDGSYIRIEDNDSQSIMYGEMYGIADGEIFKL